ncbi:somatotropin-2-like isoform X2 [Oncorhynchus keta]|uniref:somatotropin-2-like isoform X2 n=1 Tax=Oncorhynchus keta TaxID=8018 RepID=UPI00227B52F9|nr:somatotropin-2-like isoform X2 [Oncorhynchus keta]
MENQQLHIGQRFHLLAQKMSNAFVLKLRHISFHLNVSWEYSSQTLTISNSLMVRNSNQILAKLRDHKVGINLLIKGSQDGILSLDDNDSQHLPPAGTNTRTWGNLDVSLGL